jgi:HSP20 family protein
MRTLVKSNGNLFPTFPSLFDDFFTRDFFNRSSLNQSSADTIPAVNIQETDSSFKLEVAAPGMTKKDFKVEFLNNMIIISAQRENQSEDKDQFGNYTRKEFSYQSFKRSFRLPEGIAQENNISAKYSDGVLSIIIPKNEITKINPAKLIEIS